jgi:hypothetical protein
VLVATALPVITFFAASIYATLSYQAHVNELMEKRLKQYEERLKHSDRSYGVEPWRPVRKPE